MHTFASLGLSAARRVALRLLAVVLPEDDDRTAGRPGPVPRQQRSPTAPTDGPTGEMLSAEQVHTVSFGVDGVTYEIDLPSGRAAALRQDLAPWVAHARKTARARATGRNRRRTAAAMGGGDTTTIRQWARAHGHTVSDRGRLPAAVRQAYNSTH